MIIKPKHLSPKYLKLIEPLKNLTVAAGNKSNESESKSNLKSTNGKQKFSPQRDKEDVDMKQMNIDFCLSKSEENQ